MWESNKNSKFSHFVHDVLTSDGLTRISEKPDTSHSIVSLNQHKNSDTLNGFLPSGQLTGRLRVENIPGSEREKGEEDDIPHQTDPHGPEIINGVESEEVEEVNDAYNDLINDLGERYIEKIVGEKKIFLYTFFFFILQWFKEYLPSPRLSTRSSCLPAVLCWWWTIS